MSSSDNNPFVGLRPFESDESLLFFGRQEQTFELLQRLHQNHFVAVVGSSGSGKSSLIRAGLIPGLKAGYLVKDRDKWIISIMKPGQSPLCNLAEAALIQQYETTTNALSISDLEEKIKDEGADAVVDILKPLLKSDTNFFLLVDQFEELFRFSIDQKNAAKKDEAIDFVNILLELSANKQFPVYIVMTMRSDFIGDCARFYGLPEAINQSQYLVPRLNRVQLKSIIEGPLRLVNTEIASGLTARLLNDTQAMKDELPLLQHALMRIWDYKKKSGGDNRLSLEDYKDIGGLEKALSNHADEALQGMSQQDLDITKKIFQALTTIDEDGRKIRRPVRVSQLEEITGADKTRLHSILNRFIEDNRSFLVINKVENKADELIDISHESLIRQWGTLNSWVDEEAGAAKVFSRLTEALKLYKSKEKDLLSGNELQQILHWYYSFHPKKDWAERYSPDYDSSIGYLKESEKEEKKQRAKKLRLRKIVFASVVLIALVIAAFSIVIYKNYIRNKSQLVLSYWQNSTNAKAENNSLNALLYLVQAADLNDNKELSTDLMVDAEAYLPQVSLEDIIQFKNIVTNAVFSPDGQSILAVMSDGSMVIVDKTTTRQKTLIQPGAVINGAVFSNDGSRILTSSNDGTARVLETATGKQLLLLQHEHEVTSAAFSPGEKMILTTSADGARLWDAMQGTPLSYSKVLQGISSALFSPDAKWILAITRNDFADRLYRVTTSGKFTFSEVKLYTFNDVVTGAIFTPDGTKILSINSDFSVRLTDVAHGTERLVIRQKAPVTSAVFSPDGKWILTASKDKTASLWDATTGRQSGIAMKHDGPVYSASFSADDKWIITAGLDKTVRIWKMPTTDSANLPAYVKLNNVTHAVFNPNGKNLLTIDKTGSIHQFDIASGKQTIISKLTSPVTNAAYSSDGKFLTTAGPDNYARIYDAGTNDKTATLKHAASVSEAVYSADGHTLLTVSNHSFVSIWNMSPVTFDHPKSSFDIPDLKSASLSPDGSKVLVTTEDSAAHMLNATTGKELLAFNHDDLVSSAVFSADGKYVLTASWDKTARLWSAATGQQIGSAMKSDAYLNNASFSADGKWILNAGWDKSVHLWSTITFKEIGIPKQLPNVVNEAMISADKKSIVAITKDSTAYTWQVAGDLDLPPALFKLQSKALTGVELNLETNETQCIAKDQWQILKDEYNRQAQEHYHVCKYAKFNLWRRFQADEAAQQYALR